MSTHHENKASGLSVQARRTLSQAILPFTHFGIIASSLFVGKRLVYHQLSPLQPSHHLPIFSTYMQRVIQDEGWPYETRCCNAFFQTTQEVEICMYAFGDGTLARVSRSRKPHSIALSINCNLLFTRFTHPAAGYIQPHAACHTSSTAAAAAVAPKQPLQQKIWHFHVCLLCATQAAISKEVR